MSISGPLTRDMLIETVRWHNLGGVPPLSASPYSVYPVHYYKSTVTRRPEYVFVARCKQCHREYHLDPDKPIAPIYCGVGITHGCGTSEWDVFKRRIEVETEDEYVDDCAYSDTRVTKQHRLVGTYVEPGCITLPPMTRKEINRFYQAWWYQMSESGEALRVASIYGSYYGQVKMCED